jgi:hypothetical protein
VDEPGKFVEVCGAKNFEFGLLGKLLRDAGRHPSMLTGSPALPHPGHKLFLAARVGALTGAFDPAAFAPCLSLSLSISIVKYLLQVAR